MRSRDVARLGYGLALLLDPQRTSSALAGPRLDRRARVTARVLGVRHVAQAVVLIADDRPFTRTAARAIDLSHAASMALLAAWVPGRARVALTDAAIAAVLAGGAAPLGQRVACPPSKVSSREPPESDLLDLPRPTGTGGVDVSINDADGPSARRRRNALMQQAVYEAFQTARGATQQQARDALGRALQKRGVPLPPPAWLEAAAAELAAGNLYVVSGPAMQDVGLKLPPYRPI
jgi:hypothetical protein